MKTKNTSQTSTSTCCWPYWMAVTTKHNRNGCHGSIICDFWLWLAFKMDDNMINDKRLSQMFHCPKLQFQSFIDTSVSTCRSLHIQQVSHQRWIWWSHKWESMQGIHPGFETWGRCHQKSKKWVSVAPWKGLMSSKKFFKKSFFYVFWVFQYSV